MQWDDTANAGFSTADASKLYLPIDPDPNRPTVAAQLADPGSTLQLVHRLLEIRRAHPALGARASTRVVNAGYPLAYIRGETHLVVVNPRREISNFEMGELVVRDALLASGAEVLDGRVVIDGFGYAIYELQT